MKICRFMTGYLRSSEPASRELNLQQTLQIEGALSMANQKDAPKALHAMKKFNYRFLRSGWRITKDLIPKNV